MGGVRTRATRRGAARSSSSFVTSSGSDEAAQRADAVTVKQMKPMFVIDGTSGLSTLASVLAADKYIVFSYGTTTQESLDQQPYRWGQNDANAAIVNSAQFIGRQLAKKKAEFAGDTAMQSKPRTFGAVVPSNYDIDAVRLVVQGRGHQARHAAARVHDERITAGRPRHRADGRRRS